MPTIYFVRHGEAAATFGQHRDPGLSHLGIQQAEQATNFLVDKPEMPIYSSPLKRAQETATPLVSAWNKQLVIEERVAEIPSPIDDLTDRTQWLAKVMSGTWNDLSPELQQWRSDLIDCVVSQPEDCVYFSHFVAINILVGAAKGLAPLISFRPDNASITTFTTDGNQLEVIELGRIADTHIN